MSRLYLNSNFENYDIELKKYFKTNIRTYNVQVFITSERIGKS